MAWNKSKTMHSLVGYHYLQVCLYGSWITAHPLLHSYSGRKLARFGRSVDWSFLMSLAETRQASSVNCFKFFRVFRCRSPAEVILEFEIFKEINPVKPVHRHWSRDFRTYIQTFKQQHIECNRRRINTEWVTERHTENVGLFMNLDGVPETNSKVLSVRLQFWERLSTIKEDRSLMFFTPASVNPPPHISRDCRFLKSGQTKHGSEKWRTRI